MSVTDTDEQCVLENNGQWFLLPRYRRAEALEYIETANSLLTANQVPDELPDFLIHIFDPADLIFYQARTPTLPDGMFGPAVFKVCSPPIK